MANNYYANVKATVLNKLHTAVGQLDVPRNPSDHKEYIRFLLDILRILEAEDTDDLKEFLDKFADRQCYRHPDEECDRVSKSRFIRIAGDIQTVLNKEGSKTREELWEALKDIHGIGEGTCVVSD